MKPIEIPHTKSAQFTKERMFDNAGKKENRTPRKLKKKRKKHNQRRQT